MPVLNEVKSYLKQHNLIQNGCNAPNNILRKLYESAMTTGEITNFNREKLMHNILKSELPSEKVRKVSKLKKVERDERGGVVW